MVVIRLTRVGKKNSPAYRVVVADRRRAVKRKFIEVIGHYNPIMKPKEIVIDKERALFWMSKGAVPSDTVRNLMADLDIIKKSEKVNKVYGREKKKKELKEEAGAKKPEAAPPETKEEEVAPEEANPDTVAPETSDDGETPAEVAAEKATVEDAKELKEEKEAPEDNKA